MSRLTVYTTKTTLALEIESDFYRTIFAYVAREVNPRDNDPTSNPQLIFEMWCRVAMDTATDEEIQNWEDHRQILKAIAFRFYSTAPIDYATYKRILKRMSRATAVDAKPLLLIIEGIEESRLAPGDNKTELGFPENWERVIPDLKPTEFQVSDLLTCE